MSKSSKEMYEKLKEEALEKRATHEKRPTVMIGAATCGVAAGALEVKEAFLKEIEKNNLDAQVIEVGCIGHCYAEPLVAISREGFPTICYNNVDDGKAERLVQDYLRDNDPCYDFAMVAVEPNDEFPTFADFPRGVYENKIIFANSGFISPGDIDQSIAVEGYAALAKALEMTPEEVIENVIDSGLRGRGGAGFPAGVKWKTCRESGGNDVDKYVICNADEGDPGAFMDRGLLESDPHLLIEGMIIAGYAIGAETGYIYVRAEYPRAIEHLNVALEQAREKRLLGKNILGTQVNFDITLFQGSGAFVCGESSALVRSMEGKTGIPQSRPPRLAVAGFRGKPTVINNVKTLSYVPSIIREGPEWFKSIGTEESPGTAVFSLVGKVVNTGLVEVPMGTTLRNLIYDVGGGIPNDKAFKAVQIGGPSGGCLPESALDIPIDFDSLDEAGAIMGSGGVVVLDEDDCMVAVARYFLEFTQQESCGKCTFCRLGTKHLLDLLNEITSGTAEEDALEKLKELAEDVKNGSLCNLGKTAPTPILTTLRYFYDEYEAHVKEKRCPSLMCENLIVYYIEPKKCSKLCSACVGSCPTEAIYTREDGIKAIEQEKCVNCDSCLKACPVEYLAVVKLSPPSLLEEKEGEGKK